MTDQHNQSRRNLVKILSSTSLLPLAGGSATAALLAACGGGNSGASTPQLKALRAASVTSGTAAFVYPRLTSNFDAAVTGLNLAEDIRFGTAAIADGAASVAINTLANLGTLFNPLEGDFNANGAQGGTAYTTINAEIQRYATAFNAQNHVLETDGLRLQAVLGAGHFNSYLRGNVVRASNGFNIGAAGATTPTRIVDLGLALTDLANIEVGTCITAGSSGLAVVTAKDAAAGTITLEAVNSGFRTASSENFHVTFTQFAFARILNNVTNNTTTEVKFKTPVASVVVPGMFALGVASGTAYNTNPTANDRAKVLSISADRLTVTFDAKVSLAGNGATVLNAATNDGVLFIPGLTSGQIWSKRPYGPQQTGHQVQALQVEITMPSMPQFAGGGIWTKAAAEQALASAPGTLWGYWPAVWFYTFNPTLTRPTPSSPSSEVDVLELFTRTYTGVSTWSGFLHTQPYTRTVALQPNSTTLAVNGGTWLSTPASSSTTREIQTANVSYLLMPQPIANGQKRTVGVIWTRDKVIHYLDGIPVSESVWATSTVLPHQLGINLACGSLAGGNTNALFFPQEDAQATGQFLKIHSIKTWEL